MYVLCVHAFAHRIPHKKTESILALARTHTHTYTHTTYTRTHTQKEKAPLRANPKP